MKASSGPLFVSSLGKALDVLDVFLAPPHSYGLTAVVEATGLEKSAVQRILFTLHEKGWLQRDDATRRYTLSLRFVEGAFANLINDPLMIHASPHVIALSRELRETVNVARLDGHDIVFVNRLPARNTSYVATVTGRRVRALNTSGGRAIVSCRSLAEIDEICATWPIATYRDTTELDREVIRQRIIEAKTVGYAITNEQLMVNEIGVSAPIRDQSGVAIAAIQVSVSNLRWDADRVKRELLPSVVDASKAIVPPCH